MRCFICTFVFFIGRVDRYNHDLEDDTDDTDDSPVFGLFSSCSPQYRKTHSSRINSTPEQDSASSSFKVTTSVATTPDVTDAPFIPVPDYRMRVKPTVLMPDKEIHSGSPPTEPRKVISPFTTYVFGLINFFYRFPWNLHERSAHLNRHRRIAMMSHRKFTVNVKQVIIVTFYPNFLYL